MKHDYLYNKPLHYIDDVLNKMDIYIDNYLKWDKADTKKYHDVIKDIKDENKNYITTCLNNLTHSNEPLHTLTLKNNNESTSFDDRVDAFCNLLNSLKPICDYMGEISNDEDINKILQSIS